MVLETPQFPDWTAGESEGAEDSGLWDEPVAGGGRVWLPEKGIVSFRRVKVSLGVEGRRKANRLDLEQHRRPRNPSPLDRRRDLPRGCRRESFPVGGRVAAVVVAWVSSGRKRPEPANETDALLASVHLELEGGSLSCPDGPFVVWTRRPNTC